MQGRKQAVVISGRGATTLLVQVEKKTTAKSFGRDGGIRRGKKKHSSAGVIGSDGCANVGGMTTGYRWQMLEFEATEVEVGLRRKVRADSNGSARQQRWVRQKRVRLGETGGKWGGKAGKR
ncbi:hypothetical protein B296_00042789 [Ensete ventricosum]|uniref:Uncharacterized protein n=1 Tax=Ensete ventricosum TaxID=4639 RepID=A0A426XSH2_ENSVE|nr:hypothetical protein B296_00042789 [Ensete ventricosum]